VVRAEQGGLCGEHLGDSWIEAFSQQRQQLGSDPIPRNPHIVIRRVVDEGNLLGLEKGPQLGARTIDQRPDDDTVSRMHRSETTSSGSADEPQEERFRLVVPGVADGDDVGLVGRDGATEKVVAHHVGSRLEGTVRSRRGRADVDTLEHERQASRSSDLPAELLVIRSRGAKLMIEVSDRHELQCGSAIEGTEEVKQRHRIGSARQRDNDTRPRCTEPIALKRPPDTSEQRHADQTGLEQEGNGAGGRI